MFKKILLGSSAYQYLPLARRLWNKMPEGKKSYRFPGVYIDLAKGAANYVRIRADEIKRDAICLYATYTYNIWGEYSVSIWRVDMRGNLDILTIPGKSITTLVGMVTDIKCGRFNHDNPSEFILCIQDTPPSPTTVNYVPGKYRPCLTDSESKANQRFFKISVDFDSMRITCDLIKTIQYYNYYRQSDLSSDCNVYYLPGSWELRWHYQRGSGIEEYFKDSILDMFVDNSGIRRLLEATKYKYTWKPCGLWNMDTQSSPPPESKRGHETIFTRVYFEGGDDGFVLEDTDREKYTYKVFTGTQYKFGEKFIESSNYLVDVVGCKIINSQDFIYAKNDANDKAHVEIGATGHGKFVELIIPYVPALGTRSGNRPIYPSITLLKDRGISTTINARFIETFSWGRNDFSSYTLWIGSYADPLKGNSSIFENNNTFLTGFPNPFKEDQYLGVWYSDAPDFGYGGLGWSYPPIWDGFFTLPFSSWDGDLKGWQDVKPVEIKDYALSLPNHYFNNFIIIPKILFRGFYIKGAEVFADYGADILLDVTIIQTKNDEIYVNGDEKTKSVDKNRLKLK